MTDDWVSPGHSPDSWPSCQSEQWPRPPPGWGNTGPPPARWSPRPCSGSTRSCRTSQRRRGREPQSPSGSCQPQVFWSVWTNIVNYPTMSNSFAYFYPEFQSSGSCCLFKCGFSNPNLKNSMDCFMLISFRISFSGRNFTKSASNFVSRNVGNSIFVNH